MDNFIDNITNVDVENSAKQISEKKQDVKYDTRDYVIKYLVKQYEEGEFYIPLDYQRNFIWGDRDRCNFIESILMGLPIPFMFFADTNDGRIEIVDGAQRMQTLIQFAQNDLTLRELKILTNSNGFCFNNLDLAIQRRFLNTSIRVVFLEEGTTEKTRQEIFKRINTGGERATATEARRGSFNGKFKNFIEECTKNELFNQLAPRTKLTEDRYEGFELVSRFFAYSDNFNSNYDGYDGNVAEYIDEYIFKKNNQWESSEENNEIESYRKRFENMLEFAHKLLGDQGFRKTPKSKSTPRARFEAISVGIALALADDSSCSPNPNNNEWISSDEFTNITRSDAANNKSKLINRISFVRDSLLR